MLKAIAFGALAFYLPTLGNGEAAAQSSKLTVIVVYPARARHHGMPRRARSRGHLGKHLPGQTAVPFPQVPWRARATSPQPASSTPAPPATALNHRDLCTRSRDAAPLLDNQGIAFDARQFDLAGTPGAEVQRCLPLCPLTAFGRWTMFPCEMIFSDQPKRERRAIFPFVLNSVIGTKFKVVLGCPKKAETMLLARSESCEADGEYRIVVELSRLGSQGPAPSGKSTSFQIAFRVHPGPPDVSAGDGRGEGPCRRKEPSNADLLRQMMAAPPVAPPGVAPDRVAALRQAFDAVMKDPEFRADAARQSLDIDPFTGPEIETMIQKVYANTPEVVARAKAALQDGKN